MPPDKGFMGTWPIANTWVIPVCPEKDVIVTLHDAEVAEKSPTIKVAPVEQPKHGQSSVGINSVDVKTEKSW